MTVTLFATILTIGAMLNALLTEAIKKAYENEGKEYSPNVVALADALIIGGAGTAAVYMLMAIPWTINNIICLLIMIVAVWIASMIGYDKVLQLAKQVEAMTPVKTEEKQEVKPEENENHKEN